MTNPDRAACGRLFLEGGSACAAAQAAPRQRLDQGLPRPPSRRSASPAQDWPITDAVETSSSKSAIDTLPLTA